jgi:hypothetical protein
MQKTFLAEFVYNNSIHSIINISLFFAIYGFYSNISFIIKNDYSKRKMPIAKEMIKKFKSESKKLMK